MKVNLEITGESEMLLRKLRTEKGMSERQALAKALRLLMLAHDGRLAEIDVDGQVVAKFTI